MEFHTGRLFLRPINIEDKESTFAYRSDIEINKYQGWIPETIADVEEFIKKTAQQFNEPESWFQLVIIEKKTNTIIGDLGVHFYGSENKQVELGCTIHKDYHKNGFATEALNCIINYLFNNLKKHRITTSIDPENLGSIRLVEKIGFRKEAHFVESIFLNGKWVDDLIYAILQKDWKTK